MLMMPTVHRHSQAKRREIMQMMQLAVVLMMGMMIVIG